MKRIHKLILSGALVLAVGIIAVAINIPNTFVDGTPISASDMNQNFRVIQRDLNRNVVRIDPNNGYALVKGLYAKNPNNPSANFNFDWLNDVPRLRVGGTGVGSKTGLDIQTQGNRSLMRLNYDGTVDIKDLLVRGSINGIRHGGDFNDFRLYTSSALFMSDLGSIGKELIIQNRNGANIQASNFTFVTFSPSPGQLPHDFLFTNEGDIKADGNVYADSFITRGADLSEPFDITSTKQLEPGMVVSIDPKEPGKLQVSTEAYDRKVVGIISGAGGVKTGIILKQEDVGLDGEYPVALTGRVYAWADASHGAIEPGDLLTTSETPGYTMKVDDHSQALGATIGKAMSSLDEGQGLVLVLVALQ